jgi:hypothetical protein
MRKMKVLRFMPFAFLAGAQGFALLAPYLALILAIASVMYWRRAE